MHSLIVLEKRNTLYSWVIILCLSTFILSVTGTFLVRSGILNSVHTFASDPSRGIYILSFLSLMIFSALTIFFIKHKKETYNFNFKSRETFILTNNWFMIFFLATVLIGMLYPIFLDVLTNVKISVGPPFFNIVIIPLVIPLLFLMAIGPKFGWVKSQNKIVKKILFLILGATIINLFIFYFFGKYSLLSNLIFIAAIFLILHSILEIIKFFNKKKKPELPRIVSHLGFGLLVFFIGINHQFSLEMDFNLKNNSVEYLDPEIRIYSNPETLTYEAAIKTKITSDLYLTMSNVSRSDYYNIKFQNKPFMIWIWLSALMIASGGFMYLTSKK
jgi:cytochrome c-type biogenesis protein CcmF